jgi:hypothetical protein
VVGAALGGSVNTVKNVDLAPDGKRIVALMPVESADGQKVRRPRDLPRKFRDDVRRKVPVRQVTSDWQWSPLPNQPRECQAWRHGRV